MATRQHALFRLVDRPSPDVAHEACYVYGTAGAGVDTGVIIEFEGTLFLSLAAVKEMAEVAGFSVNEEGQALEVENANLQHQLAEAIAERDDANEQLRVLGGVLARAASKKS